MRKSDKVVNAGIQPRGESHSAGQEGSKAVNGKGRKEEKKKLTKHYEK